MSEERLWHWAAYGAVQQQYRMLSQRAGQYGANWTLLGLNAPTRRPVKSHRSRRCSQLRTKCFYIKGLVHLPVLSAHIWEPPYKTFLYGDFLNLYGGGLADSIFTTKITAPSQC